MPDRQTENEPSSPESSSPTSRKASVRPASGPPDDPTEPSSSSPGDGPGKREDRGPRPPGLETGSEGDEGPASETLKRWERTIREAQERVLAACRRIAWIAEEEAYRKRGYDTGSQYGKEVLGMDSRQRWHQRKRAGQVMNALKEWKSSNAFDDPVPLPSTEAQTQPLHRYREDPSFLGEVWKNVVEEHGASPRRKDVKSVVKDLESGEEEDEEETGSEGGSGDGSEDGSSGDTSSQTGGPGDSPDRDIEETGDNDSGSDSPDDTGPDGESSGGGGSSSTGSSGETSDDDGSSSAGSTSGRDDWAWVGGFAVRLPDDADTGRQGSGSSSSEPTRQDIQALAKAADSKEARLGRSSTERAVASRVWRVLAPSPDQLGSALPEERASQAAFRPSRLDQVVGLPPGAEAERMLVCPGVDLFGEAVPAAVIEAILERSRESKHAPVVFTRHLDRAGRFDLSGIWIGTPAERGSLSSASQSLKRVASDAAVRWVLYDVKNEDRMDPPSYSEVIDWVVFDPPGGAGVSLTIGQTQALIGAAEDAGARWAFRATFKTNGASGLPTADEASDDDGEDDSGEASSTQSEAF